eukprot:Ihof_evm4s212 gene=Ihof_evmTU4s212
MDHTLGEALRVWVNGFEGVTEKAETLADLTDGVALYELMAEVAPMSFDTSMLKYGVKDNWRLKASNVKRLINGMMDMYNDELFMDTSTMDVPEANEIAQNGDVVQVIALVKLALGCVINCDNKEVYIQKMASLDVSVQTALMNVIQEIIQKHPSSWGQEGEEMATSETSKNIPSTSDFNDDESFQNMKNEISLLQSEKHNLENKNKELSREMAYVRETLSTEKDKNAELEEKIEQYKNYEDPATPSGKALTAAKKENERLKEDLDSIDHQRHTLKLENVELLTQIDALHKQIDELTDDAGRNKHWKDEVDIMKTRMEKIDQMEEAIDTYKQKLEQMSDLMAHVKALELQNKELANSKLQLEDRLNRHKGLKTQLDENKINAASMEQSVQDLLFARDQAQEEAKAAQEQVRLLEDEKQRHLDTITDMKETIEGLEMQVADTPISNRASFGGLGLLSAPLPLTVDTEAVANLQMEIAHLKKDLAEEREKSAEVIQKAQAPVPDKKLMKELRDTKRQLKRLMLERQSGTVNTPPTPTGEDRGRDGDKPKEDGDLLVQIDSLLMEKNSLVAKLKRVSDERDQHKRMLEHELQQGVGVEYEAQLLSLRNQVNEKDLEVSTMKQAFKESERKWQMEQQMIVTAWYELGHRYEKLRIGERAT